ncbi:MAG TPA: hypothetical protein VH008_01980 [Pseudonocardia sp.]|jgi:hypothetical protein|nr:hypothetical protein [Pseudonocardia sp.]
MRLHRTAPWQDGDPLHSHLNADPSDLWVNPDGLKPWSINALLGAVYREIRDEPTPTTALLDGSAEEARLDRMTNRAIAALRSVPSVRAAGQADHASAA